MLVEVHQQSALLDCQSLTPDRPFDIVAQRLVRRVCDSCAEPATLSAGQQAWLDAQRGNGGVPDTGFVRGRGCNFCYLTGYRGRIGVYELLEVDADLTDKIRRQDLDGFMEAAHATKSYVPLGRSAIGYALSGITSIDEAIRVTGGIDSYMLGTAKPAADGAAA